MPCRGKRKRIKEKYKTPRAGKLPCFYDKWRFFYKIRVSLRRVYTRSKSGFLNLLWCLPFWKFVYKKLSTLFEKLYMLNIHNYVHFFLKFGYEMYKLYILILSNLWREKLVNKKICVLRIYRIVCKFFQKLCILSEKLCILNKKLFTFF